MTAVATKPGRFRSLAWRILLWMSLAALGPLLIMSVQGYHCAREAIMTSEESHLLSVLESRRTRLDSWLESISTDLRFLTVSAAVGGGAFLADEETSTRQLELLALLDGVRRESSLYQALAVFGPSWEPVVQSGEPRSQCCTILPEAEHAARSDRMPRVVIQPHERLRAQLKKEAVTAWVSLVDSAGLLPTIQVGRRIGALGATSTAGQAVGGFLVAELAVPDMVDSILLDQTGLGQTGRVYVLTPAGTYPSRYEPPVAQRASKRGWLAKLVGCTRPPGASGAGHVPHDDHPHDPAPAGVWHYRTASGELALGASHAIPELGWTLWVEVDEAEAFAWLGVLQTRAVVTGLVTLVLVGGLAVSVSRRLSRPLMRLAGVAGAIASGRVRERVEPLEGAEARHVGEAFNRMLDELARMQQRLQRSASLAAVGQLSSSIVHEMRNPLSSIKMNVQALGNQVADDPVHAELAAIASQQVGRLEQMLNELLQYGRPLELHIATVPLAELAREAHEVIALAAGEKEVRVRIQCEPPDLTAEIDREQMRRALSNLILNAIQVSPAGKTVTVRIAAAMRGAKQVRIVVDDEGPGLPAEPEEKLFRPFFSTRPGGTGLGLATVKKVLDHHAGGARAENRPEGGARFVLSLPQVRPPEPEAEEASSP